MNKEINIDERLAVLSSDVKKLITHFKLDRRKQSDDGGDSESLPDPDNALLENISASITELSTRKFFTKEQVEQLKVLAAAVSDYFEKRQNKEQAELKSLLEVIIGKLDEQQSTPQKTTTRREYSFSVDFKNSKAALTMITMGLAIAVLIGFNIHQFDRNSDLRDSDIKYRYVKMQLKASTEDIRRLESIFEYERNTDSVKTIRRQVERYEQLLKEYNQDEYRRRQDEARARKIEHEAGKIKGNK